MSAAIVAICAIVAAGFAYSTRKARITSGHQCGHGHENCTLLDMCPECWGDYL